MVGIRSPEAPLKCFCPVVPPLFVLLTKESMCSSFDYKCLEAWCTDKEQARQERDEKTTRGKGRTTAAECISRFIFCLSKQEVSAFPREVISCLATEMRKAEATL